MLRKKRLAAGLIAATIAAGPALAQQACVNDAPMLHQPPEQFATLPDGRPWGATAGVGVAPDGTIWTYERCGARTCLGSALDPVIHLSSTGEVLDTFGGGMFVFPHGMFVDAEGNVWVTDANRDGGRGWQAFKFAPDGTVLMTLGTPGGGSAPGDLMEPNQVAVAANGDILVAEGHATGRPGHRISRFAADGTFLGTFGEGLLDGPHAIAVAPDGRIFVGDRNHNRVAIFAADGTYLEEWRQFGRPSGIAILADGTIYVADSESQPGPRGYGANPDCLRAIRYGNVADGVVDGIIPDPAPTGASSLAEGVAVDAAGNVYGADSAMHLWVIRPR